MATLTAVKARATFSDVVSQVAYEKERIVLTRNGKPMVAVVPVEDLRLLESIEDRADIEAALSVLADPNEKPVSYKRARKALGLG